MIEACQMYPIFLILPTQDDVDIRFSKSSFNVCKIPQIRYATPERLLQRLTDLRFLNIDFLNTFLGRMRMT